MKIRIFVFIALAALLLFGCRQKAPKEALVKTDTTRFKIYSTKDSTMPAIALFTPEKKKQSITYSGIDTTDNSCFIFDIWPEGREIEPSCYVLLEDPNGNMTGINEDGNIFKQIPNSQFYKDGKDDDVSNQSLWFWTFKCEKPVSGKYIISIIGVNNYKYSINLRTYNINFRRCFKVRCFV